jgi:hypothetical protein
MKAYLGPSFSFIYILVVRKEYTRMFGGRSDDLMILLEQLNFDCSGHAAEVEKKNKSTSSARVSLSLSEQISETSKGKV